MTETGGVADGGNGKSDEDYLSLQYLRVRDEFFREIQSGAYPPYSQLPAERQVSDDFSISRMTARKALLQLEAEGLVFRRHRLGWFVAPPRLIYDPKSNISFTENALAQNRRPSTSVIAAEHLSAPEWLAETLLIPKQAEIYRISRVRLLDDRPAMIEIINVAAKRFPKLLDHPLEASFTRTLHDHYGIELKRARISVSSVALDQTHADMLETSPGAPRSEDHPCQPGPERQHDRIRRRVLASLGAGIENGLLLASDAPSLNAPRIEFEFSWRFAWACTACLSLQLTEASLRGNQR